MGKFRAKIGYAIPTEVKKGVWQDVIEERYHRGDILHDQHRWDSSNEVNDDLNISNRFSFVADNFMQEHRTQMKYLVFDNTRWKIHNIDLGSSPRIVITVSGVYNGPEPISSDSEEGDDNENP